MMMMTTTTTIARDFALAYCESHHEQHREG
jgi:hypothetical protein